jgi:hypothetical protein
MLKMARIYPLVLPSYWRLYLLEAPWDWRKLWCRMKGHPAGPRYYHPCALEPDWRCSECGDDLG